MTIKEIIGKRGDRRQMFSVEADAKTTKGSKAGYLTGIMYLAPANLSGYEVCSSRTTGCTAACLNTAGLGGVYKSIQQARTRKTRQFFEERSGFWRNVVYSIVKLEEQATKRDMTAVVRLNGTSDLMFERIPVKIDGKRIAGSIFDLFPHIQFYDYTKHDIRRRLVRPANYHLTFSLAEDNDGLAHVALINGVSVAAVFRKQLPETFGGFDVVDGDASDLRFLDPAGVIVGLKAKGKARNDDTGFVRAGTWIRPDLGLPVIQPV